MDEIGGLYQLIVRAGDYTFHFNLTTIMMTWIVIGLLLFFGYMATRQRHILPNHVQVVGEIIIGQFYSLTESALGKEKAKSYAPLIVALFMFLLLSNWIGAIPHMSEPTTDLNTPLSLGLMGFVLAHYAGIRAKGFKGYIKTYFEPIVFMLPMNLIGELAKVISISFRLFGNMMGGSIIILVVSYLIYSLVLPPFLYAFFSLFIGSIQAFVFTMLTIVYIAVQVD